MSSKPRGNRLEEICSSNDNEVRCCDTYEPWGNLGFHFDEINDFEVIGQPDENYRPMKAKPRLPDEPLVNECKVPAHLKNLRPVSNSELMRLSLDDFEDLDFSDLKLKLAEEYEIIDNDSQWRSALNVVQNSSCIGLAVEGTYYKRYGDIFWILITTGKQVFLIDMIALEDVVEQGLRDLLEDYSIEKVVHDSRYMCDILKHKYGCAMKNIFDTQVADLHVQKEQYGKYPTFVNSYHMCAMKYLTLPRDRVHIPRIREKRMERDLSIWKQRPLPKNLVNAAIKDVIYLLELKSVLQGELLKEFYDGVDSYMTTLRDCNEEERKQTPVQLHTLPVNFKTYLERCEGGNENAWRKCSKAYYQSSKIPEDPYVTFSRDICHWKNERKSRISPTDKSRE